LEQIYEFVFAHAFFSDDLSAVAEQQIISCIPYIVIQGTAFYVTVFFAVVTSLAWSS